METEVAPRKASAGRIRGEQSRNILANPSPRLARLKATETRSAETRSAEKKSAEWKTYRTRFLVKAKQLRSGLAFTDSLGRQHSGRKGDYLVESSDGVLSIAPRQIFEDVYVSMSGGESELGRLMKASAYIDAWQWIQLNTRETSKWWDDYDLWLTPTVAEPPERLGREFDLSLHNVVGEDDGRVEIDDEIVEAVAGGFRHD